MTTPQLLTLTELRQKPQAITTAAGGGKFLTREDVDDYYNDHLVYMKSPTGPNGLLPSSKTQRIGIFSPGGTVGFVPWRSNEPANRFTYKNPVEYNPLPISTSATSHLYRDTVFSPFGMKDAGVLKAAAFHDDPKNFSAMPYICYADGQDAVPSLVNPWENADRPACRWLSYDSAVKCCALPSSQKGKFEKVCGPSYTAGGDNCREIMTNHCSERWDSPECSQFLHNYGNGTERVSTKFPIIIVGTIVRYILIVLIVVLILRRLLRK